MLAGRDLISVGETPGATVADARLYTDPARGEVDMVFTFEHVNLDQDPMGSKWELRALKLSELKANLDAWQSGLADAGWNSLYWDNHDQPRIVSRWGDDGAHRIESAKSWATVLHLLRGTPYVYQGEEFGMTNAHFTTLGEYRDIESLNYAADALKRGLPEAAVLHSLAVKSRDNARTPVQWTDGPNAGFTDGIPWLSVNPNHLTINADAAVRDPGSVFHHYRQLIELRHALPVVVHGDVRILLLSDEQVFAYVRRLDDSVLLVIANLSSEPVTVDLDADADLLAGELLLSTHPVEQSKGASRTIGLRPWESQVFLSA